MYFIFYYIVATFIPSFLYTYILYYFLVQHSNDRLCMSKYPYCWTMAVSATATSSATINT